MPYLLKLFQAITVGLLAATLATTLFAEKQSDKPNVVFIICDDLNDFSSVLGGHPQALTPHMSRLAETAVSFQNAYSNNPVCAPSRASLYTGIYPIHQIIFSGRSGMITPSSKNCKTIMEFFRENGYRVVGTGKTSITIEIPTGIFIRPRRIMARIGQGRKRPLGEPLDTGTFCQRRAN